MIQTKIFYKETVRFDILPRLPLRGTASANSFKEAVDMSDKAKDRAYRPLVYICSPLSDDVSGNTERAKRYCRSPRSRMAATVGSLKR